jgi:hypothetical protein
MCGSGGGAAQGRGRRRGKIGAHEEAWDPPFIGVQAWAFLGAHTEVGRGGGRVGLGLSWSIGPGGPGTG